MTEDIVLLEDTDMHVVLRAPGETTIRRRFRTWAEINHMLVTMRKTPYPHGTVMKVTDWTGSERYLIRGGGKKPPEVVKLSARVVGLPANPNISVEPAYPSIDFSLPE